MTRHFDDWTRRILWRTKNKQKKTIGRLLVIIVNVVANVTQCSTGIPIYYITYIIILLFTRCTYRNSAAVNIRTGREKRTRNYSVGDWTMKKKSYTLIYRIYYMVAINYICFIIFIFFFCFSYLPGRWLHLAGDTWSTAGGDGQRRWRRRSRDFFPDYYGTVHARTTDIIRHV